MNINDERAKAAITRVKTTQDTMAFGVSDSLDTHIEGQKIGERRALLLLQKAIKFIDDMFIHIPDDKIPEYVANRNSLVKSMSDLLTNGTNENFDWFRGEIDKELLNEIRQLYPNIKDSQDG